LKKNIFKNSSPERKILIDERIKEYSRKYQSGLKNSGLTLWRDFTSTSTFSSLSLLSPSSFVL